MGRHKVGRTSSATTAATTTNTTYSASQYRSTTRGPKEALSGPQDPPMTMTDRSNRLIHPSSRNSPRQKDPAIDEEKAAAPCTGTTPNRSRSTLLDAGEAERGVEKPAPGRASGKSRITGMSTKSVGLCVEDSNVESPPASIHCDGDDEGNDDDHRELREYTGRKKGSSCKSESGLRRAWKSFQNIRSVSGRLVNEDRTQIIIVTMIAINALMMGIGTFPFVTEDPEISFTFDLVDTIFLVIFTIELGFQLLHYGYKLLLDGWLVFDLIVIVISWSFSSVQIIRAFRIFRALRLITRITIMKNLVLALFSVIPRMFAIGLLLFLVSYIFAVMCTQLFADLYPTYTDVDYWGRLDATFFSLFQIMTLDNWSAIARQTMVAYPYAWLPIIVFVIVTGFVVVNLIIAVICDAISALHEDDKAKLHGNFRDVSGQDSDLLDEGMSSSINDSVHHALELDVREQLSALETHVEELTKMQEETMLTLQMLTSSLAKHRQRRQQQCHEKKLLRRGRQLPNSSPGTAKSTAVLVQPMKVTD